jgi:hypothetical protein
LISSRRDIPRPKARMIGIELHDVIATGTASSVVTGRAST